LAPHYSHQVGAAKTMLERTEELGLKPERPSLATFLLG
jgi:hypothetical protein